MNSGYTYTNTNKCNITLGPGNRSGTLSIYDAVSGIVTPSRLNDTGFWMAFDLDYKYRYNASAVGIPTTISLNGTQITNTAYVDSDPGQITLGTFAPTYNLQPGNTPVNNNLAGRTAISVTSMTSLNRLPINNIFTNIKPFNFGSIILTYPPLSPTTSTYTWADITNTSILLSITIPGSIPTNTITSYSMQVSFSNINTSVSSNITSLFFNDSTFDSANTTITANNPGFTNATPKWILGAWRTDMTGLPFTLSNLRDTHGNSTFNIGPGNIIYERSVPLYAETITFTIATNIADSSGPSGFTTITAFYPPGNNGYGGTYNCKVNDGGIPDNRVDGGCLSTPVISNVYIIYCPYEYIGGNVTITISLGAGQNISNIS